jgi:hypothetical protein
MKKNVILWTLFIASALPALKAQTLADKLNKYSNFSGAIENPVYNPAIDANTNCPNGTGDKPAPKALKAFLIEVLGESPNDKGDYGITSGCQKGFHPLGMALDWQPGSPNLNVAIGNQVVDWLTKNDGEIARRMGIVQIIWTPKYPTTGVGAGSYGFWSSNAGRRVWEKFSGDNSHSWHVHLSFGGNADLSTSFWQQYKNIGVIPPTPPSNKVYTERISGGQQLNPGESLKSANGAHILVYQTDGNLVIYRNGVAVWHSHTNGQSAGLCAMQGDGNLVIYNAAHQAIWATGTNTCPANFLAMQDDGNLVLYTASGRAVWATGTNGGLTNMGSAKGQKLCP